MNAFAALTAVMALIFLSSLGVEYYCTKILLRLFKNREVAGRLFAVIFLPGTIVHEFAHIAMAQLLGVRSTGMDLMPRVESHKLIMGEVGIEHTDAFRRTLIGAAPFLFGFPLVTLILYAAVATGINWWQGLVVGYVVFQVVNGAFSSSKDMEGAGIVIGLFVFLGIVIEAVGVPIIATLKELSTSFVNTQRVWQLVGYLSVPLGINIGVILLGKLVTN